jgi:ribokinase
MVIKTKFFPKPGETLLGGDFFLFPGGKGANQAVAAARMGAAVHLIGKVGDDIFGKQSIMGLENEGIIVDQITTHHAKASGTALITVNAKGENIIVVAPGANETLTEKDILTTNDTLKKADIILTQLEIPIETIVYLAEKSKSLDKKMILNPAPAQKIPNNLYKLLYAITPNQTEAALLTGIKPVSLASIKDAARKLLKRGVQHVVITLGSKGAFYTNNETSFFIRAPKVKAVDSTAAGDVFNGVLAVMLAEGKDWKIALELACSAASVSVTRMGAQTSAPYRTEIERQT